MPGMPVDVPAEVAHCRADFRYFLRYWQFKNRETGEVRVFDELWPGQEAFAEMMAKHRWLFALKAGKLGFTELEIAFDAWVALFGPPNARVHLFSKDGDASRELLRYLKFGLYKLPTWMGVRVLAEQAGGMTARSVRFRATWMGPDDERAVVSYAATGNVAIDQTATHSHVDELSHMQDAEGLWNSVATTVAPEGSCHIVTRGAGDSVYSAELWAGAQSAGSKLVPFFAAWDARPGRDRAFREQEAGHLSALGLSYFLPETPDDALAGDESSPYVPLERWDALADAQMPDLLPGDRTPLVLGVDAAVLSDSFGIVAVSRHWDPKRHDDIAIRKVKLWRPGDFASGRIDFDVVEQWVRLICEGGCANGHARSRKAEGCRSCTAGEVAVRPFNVVQLAYDPYQLEDMTQRLNRDGVVWSKSFDQGTERLVGDGLLYRLAMAGRLVHDGNAELREHVGNARAKLQTDQESHMRIVKKSPQRKIDLAVAAAMAAKRCGELNL